MIESKRLKMSNGSNGTDGLLPSSPSCSIMVSNLPKITLSDLIKLFEKFGSVRGALFVSDTSAAIDYYDPSIVSDMLTKAKNMPFYVGQSKAPLEEGPCTLLGMFQNFTSGNAGGKGPESMRVLHFEITLVQYPITVDVMKTICGSQGKLLRILVGSKNNDVVEALVEYSKKEEAQAALENLNGADIYSGCCTLKVTHSKLVQLTVTMGDPNGWEAPELQDMSMGPPAVMGGGPMMGQNPKQIILFAGQAQVAISPCDIDPSMMVKAAPEEIMTYAHEEGSMLLVNNIPPGLNCDHLFNLFCVYGNVGKIKFLLSRPGSAIVQMGNNTQADTVIRHLNYKPFFGKKLLLTIGKNMVIQDAKNVISLPDGTPSQKSYINHINNRFMTHLAASKQRELVPHSVLYFFNFPSDLSQGHLCETMRFVGAPQPQHVNIVKVSGGAKPSTGMIDFGTVELALVALTLANHCVFRHINVKKQPHHMKLSFYNSKNTIVPNPDDVKEPVEEEVETDNALKEEGVLIDADEKSNAEEVVKYDSDN